MTTRRSVSLGLAATALLAGSRAIAADDPADFDAAGYRRQRYRAPVDRDPAPARQITVAAAGAWHAARAALFIDVLPALGGRRDTVTGEWMLAAPHDTIPGAQWHPGAGPADPDRALWQGLLSAAAADRRQHPRRPLIVFCRQDCWMSWNAARRLAAEGWRGVWWLAEGIEGWHAAGLPLVPAHPVRIPVRR